MPFLGLGALFTLTVTPQLCHPNHLPSWAHMALDACLPPLLVFPTVKLLPTLGSEWAMNYGWGTSKIPLTPNSTLWGVAAGEVSMLDGSSSQGQEHHGVELQIPTV